MNEAILRLMAWCAAHPGASFFWRGEASTVYAIAFRHVVGIRLESPTELPWVVQWAFTLDSLDVEAARQGSGIIAIRFGMVVERLINAAEERLALRAAEAAPHNPSPIA